MTTNAPCIEAKLKAIIQDDPDDKKLERLAAVLVGKLLQTRIYVASSGFQFGADNGTAGERGRDLRIECRKYSDTTNLRPRDVLGAFEQSRMYDGALEAWVFVVTREVPQQIADSLKLASEESGVPVVILDLPENKPGRLSPLCAFEPEIVSTFSGAQAGDLARDLQPFCGLAIAELRRSLEPWYLGFKSLRESRMANLKTSGTSQKRATLSWGRTQLRAHARRKASASLPARHLISPSDRSAPQQIAGLLAVKVIANIGISVCRSAR